MRDMMWTYATILFLLSEARSMNPVVRNVTFNLGSEVNLTCGNKTWTDMLYIVWNIDLHYRNRLCLIGFRNYDGRNTCKNGKSLRNTSSAQSYLRIQNFSENDVGLYMCESVYRGGAENYEIHVGITVPPNISAWLESKDNKMVAVCTAQGRKPAANISWSHMGNSSIVKTMIGSEDIFIESRLELLEGMDTENLSCIIRHPFWKDEQILVPKLKKGFVPWLYILTVVVIIMLLAGVLFYAQKKLITLRRCKQSETSPSKSPPTEDMEEVEPYASYVQRVNSIYNSSVELFT
ncbi:cell surface glycoprotein CD200 receptor 1-B isoform X2 [Cottoperca gobio]|uniref:Cell surface glycoprotein CD200 receptor 1-B isoform X2 n=1 Tax=Cottoperca gobio TaxID=56716 RepID=A0A6J2S081_COTGO|nr:cell surface glycoprotein CD200 receptor 1 isoform X2 [Cottoperca gobio]